MRFPLGYEARSAIEEFVHRILHGDDDHKQWLKDAGEQFSETGQVPPPRGKGTTNA